MAAIFLLSPLVVALVVIGQRGPPGGDLVSEPGDLCVSMAVSSFCAARSSAPDSPDPVPSAVASSARVRRRPRSPGGSGQIRPGRPQPQVLVDAAGQVPQPAVEDRVLLVGDPLDEVPVVRDDDQGAGPGVEQILERGEHVGVQVVGRLVEDQHVGLVQQDQQQLQPPALAAGEVLDRGGQLTGREAQPLQQLARGEFLGLGTGSDGVVGPQPLDDDPDGSSRCSSSSSIRWVRVATFTVTPRLTRPAVGVTVPAMRPSRVDLPAPLTRECRVRSPEQGARRSRAGCPAVVGDRGTLQVDDVLAEPGDGQGLQLDRVADLRHVGDQRVGRVDAEFGLGRPGGRAPPQPRQLLAGQVLSPDSMAAACRSRSTRCRM